MLPDDFIEEVHRRISASWKESSSNGAAVWIPNQVQLASAIDAAFWASLQSEEGRPVILDIGFVAPGEQPNVLPWEQTHSHVIPIQGRLPLTAQTLVKLFAALHYGRSTLAVHGDDVGLCILGIATYMANISVRIVRGGSLILRSGATNIAVVARDSAWFIDRAVYEENFDLPRREMALPGLEATPSGGSVDAVYEMMRHGHGGTILVVEAGSTPKGLEISYRPPVAFDGVAKADTSMFIAWHSMNAEPPARSHEACLAEAREHAEERRVLIEVTGRTTAIDGATVVDSDLALLGFGAKIGLEDLAPVVLAREPVEGVEYAPADQTGWGTRHRSAARFVAANRGSRAVVCSQDGRVTMMRHDGDTGAVRCVLHAEWLL